ncbi:START-like domain-containing protein [Nonlabens ponticola]|uniref:SRPBCC domain-containing protein n=1 Tax=Nonlabens ponticola TaxID=2496866 RepID=A0A3S9MYW8_9FLAO|nr:START-like domain-containing protein [Nonlabens ponticola]AZQ44451.1 SRPBCC domain-containing protein [Nonlabens ponticola]
MQDPIKFEMEFVVQVSPSLLYQYIATPSGMSEWFADNVNSRGEYFRFIWDGQEEKAKIIKRVGEERARFQWDYDEDTKKFFELRIEVDDITKDVSLMITDFGDDEDEVEEQKMFWENQISGLKKILGSR